VRAPLYGPWQTLAGVPGPTRLLASDAPIHQHTCDVTGSQAIWYNHMIVAIVIMVILTTIIVIMMRFQLAGSGWARYTGVSAVDVHYVCSICALHVHYVCITCASAQARQPSEMRLRDV